MTLGDMFRTLTRGYVYTRLAKGAVKLIRRTAADLDLELEPDYWLHKAGLSTYRPLRGTFGGLSIFLLGAVAGGALGLALAPKAGVELRNDMKDRAMGLIGRGEAIKGQVQASA